MPGVCFHHPVPLLGSAPCPGCVVPRVGWGSLRPSKKPPREALELGAMCAGGLTAYLIFSYLILSQQTPAQQGLPPAAANPGCIHAMDCGAEPLLPSFMPPPPAPCHFPAQLFAKRVPEDLHPEAEALSLGSGAFLLKNILRISHSRS